RRHDPPGVVPALPAARRHGRADQRAVLGLPGLFRCGQPQVAGDLGASRPGQPVDPGGHPVVDPADLLVAAPPSLGLRPGLSSRMPRRRFRPDNFTLTLLGTVVLASLLPCRGETARIFDVITNAAIALLFFLHGAKLPRQAIVQA